MILNFLFAVIVLFLTAILILAVFLLLKKQNKSEKQENADENYESPVIVVQKGGKVIFSNDEFRNLFDLSAEAHIDLDSLSKKTNKPEDFFEIFIKPGSYKLEINHISTDITSVETRGGMFVSFHLKETGFADSLINKNVISEDRDGQTSRELSELAKFSYSLKNIQEAEDLFSRILNKLENFLPVEIFGFILFDDQTRFLEAKKPFKGIPDPIIEIIKTKIHTQSKAETILFSNDILITEDAKENDVWDDLGLSHFAKAASINEAILIPLTPANEVMGYILAANHREGVNSFSQDEIHSLIIIANQSAPIIENFYLLLQAKNRTHRAEALRRISSLISSSATLEEILTYSVKEVAYLLQADFGAIYLIDQDNQKLKLNRNSLYGNTDLMKDFQEISIKDSDFPESVTFQKMPLLLGRFDELIQTPLFYDKLLNRLNLQSAIIFPIVFNDESVGEMFFGNHLASFFDQNDVSIIASVAAMLANIIEKENLSAKALEAYQEKIEQEKLVNELQRINQFNQRIISLNMDEILSAFLDESRKLLPAGFAGWIGIVDEDSRLLIPKYVEGFSDSIKGIKFEIHHMFLNFPSDDVFVNNHLDFLNFYGLNEEQSSTYLASTNFQIPMVCLMAPIRTPDRLIGVLVLENYDDESLIDDENKSIIQSLLHQVKMAIVNVELFEKADLQTNRLRILSDLSSTISSTLDWKILHDSLLIHLKKLVEYDTATLWVKEEQHLRIKATHGFMDKENREGIVVQIEDSSSIREMFETKKPALFPTLNENSFISSNDDQSQMSWLGVPLIYQSDVIGVIALEKMGVGFFTQDLVQLVESFASQAAIALVNADLYEKSKVRLESLDEKTRILDWLNRYSSEVNKTLDIEKISLLAINHLTELLHCDQVSILFLSGKSDQMELFQSNNQEFTTQRLSIFNVPIFQQLIQTQGTYLIMDVEKEPGIDQIKQQFSSRGTQSILFVPLLHQNFVYGWIGVESKESRKFFHEDMELAQAIANHTSLAIRNASLYSETKSLNDNLEKRVEERSKNLLIENRNTEMLLKVATELAGSLDVDQILDRILIILNDALQVSGSFIYILEGKIKIQINRDILIGTIDLVNSQLNDLLQQAINSKSTVSRSNYPIQTGKTNCSSWIIAPLIFGEMVLGGLVVFQQNPEYFTKREIELVQAVAGQISLAINNAEIFKLVRDQSEYLGSMLRDQEIETSRSKAILEAVADGVLVTGVGSEVILINPSARKMLGVDEKFSSLSLQKLNELLGGRIQDWLSAIEGFTSHPKKYQIERSYTAKVELLDNHIISVHLTPVMWKNELLGTVSIFRDISIEVQMEQLKSDFISNISHELRTPLTSIKGYVEILLLEASGKINRQQKAFLNTIQANTSKLTKMVDEILDVNKISSENLNLEKESLNPIESIHKVVAEKQSLEDDKGKVVSFQIVEEGETPYLMLDRLRFEQIINNLLNNAMDYSFDQGKIFIKISNTEEKIDIEIEDQGIGIPLEEQGLIFDRFYRGQNAVEMNTAGAGLGLSIVKTLVEMQGGTIRLFSSGVKGEGVKVILSFPLKTIGVIR